MCLKEYYKKHISDFYPEIFYCNCGKEHSLNFGQIIFEYNAIERLEEFLAHFAPPLSSVLVISDINIYDKTARAFHKKIGRLSYRISEYTFEEVAPKACVEIVKKIVVPEDCMLIIAIGGGTIIDISKYLSGRHRLQSVAILTAPNAIGAFSSNSFLAQSADNNFIKDYIVSPVSGILCDTAVLSSVSPQVLASSFGELVAKVISIFDYKISKILGQEFMCDSIASVAYGIIDDALRRVTGSVDIAVLAENSLKMSTLCALLDSGDSCDNSQNAITNGAEVGAANAAQMLMQHEQRETRFFGERQFLLARYILPIYQSLLSSKNFFSPPPDNNKRLDCLEEFFGLSQTDAVKTVRGMISRNKAKLIEYKLQERAGDLLPEIALNLARLKRAFKTFKRLYQDDGFAIKDFLDSSTISLSLALSPDIHKANTLLGYIKDKGLLDEYLL